MTFSPLRVRPPVSGEACWEAIYWRRAVIAMENARLFTEIALQRDIEVLILGARRDKRG